MRNQSRTKKPKRPTDPSQLALAIVKEATEREVATDDATWARLRANRAAFVAEHEAATAAEAPTTEKNPAAVALGRLGGKKGGPARAAGMTAKQRTASAQKAARARWGTKPERK